MKKRKTIQRKETDGYLTVFLSLILSIMLSLCLMLVLGARENSRRMEIECVTDIGMDSILAEYHRELLRQYDLFFIDTSYGTANASYYQTASHLQDYIAYNLGGEEIFLQTLYRNLLKLELEGIDITAVSAASDDGGAVLRRQAVDVMYQRVGISYLKQIENWVNTTREYGLDTRDVMQEREKSVKQLEEWDAFFESSGDESESAKDLGNKVVSIWETGVLSFVVKDPDKLSACKINEQQYLSSRQLLQGTGMNPAVTFEDGFWEQLVFHEYILAHTGRYNQEKEDSLLKYQTEYILSGKSSDLENLKSVVYKLLGIRAAANLIHLLSSEEKCMIVESAAAIIAALLTIPEAEPVFVVVLILTWAMAESLYDVSQLLEGGRVPLLKSEADWHYGLEVIFDFGGSMEEKKETSGLSYNDYLRVMLCLQDKQTTTYRLMDIMEMDIRQTPGNKNFRMDCCIDSLTASLIYRGADGKSYHIVRSGDY
ncbi:MAG: hypothetical protein HDR08_13355 [Lachnospiraceae bacterium]|nr:hypothetical protein [Lachnospiraceae bacterium]